MKNKKQQINICQQQNKIKVYSIFLQKLNQNQLPLLKFRTEQKNLVQRKIINNNIAQNSLKDYKFDLSICYLFQIIQQFNKLSRSEWQKIPVQLRKLIKSQILRLVNLKDQDKKLQQLSDVQTLLSDGNITKNQRQFTILDFRMLSNLLLKIKPNQYQLGVIMYEDRQLVQIMRTLFSFTENQYNQMWDMSKYQQCFRSKNNQNQQFDNIDNNRFLKNQQCALDIQIMNQKKTQDLYFFNEQISYTQPPKFQSSEAFYKKLEQDYIKQPSLSKNKRQQQIFPQFKSQSPNKDQHKNKNTSYSIPKQMQKLQKQYLSVKKEGKKIKKRQKSIEHQYADVIQQNSHDFGLSMSKDQVQSSQTSSSEEIQNQNSSQEQQKFIKKQRQRIYSYAINLKIQEGGNMFKNRKSTKKNRKDGQDKKLASQIWQAYETNRRKWLKRNQKIIKKKFQSNKDNYKHQ